jgi:hypothetical protein
MHRGTRRLAGDARAEQQDEHRGVENMETAYSLLLLIGDPAAAAGATFPAKVLAWLIPVSMFVMGATLPRLRRRRAPRAEEEALALGGIPTYRSAGPVFRRELERVRRYERSLAIVVAKLDDGHVKHSLATAASEQSDLVVAAGRQVLFAHVGQILRDLLRELDVVTCDLANRRYVILLPELGRSEADSAVRRLEGLIVEATGARIRAGVAEFGTDGLLIEDLVNVAAMRCDQPRLELAPSASPAVASDESAARRSKLSIQG